LRQKQRPNDRSEQTLVRIENSRRDLGKILKERLGLEFPGLSGKIQAEVQSNIKCMGKRSIMGCIRPIGCNPKGNSDIMTQQQEKRSNHDFLQVKIFSAMAYEATPS